MQELSTRVKRVSELLSDTLGVGVSGDFYRYYDDAHGTSITMLHAIDRPNPGVTTYATVGLSDYPMMLRGKEFQLRLEMIASCEKELSGFDNMMAELAFGVASGNYFCAPGVWVPRMVEKYKLSSTMTDVYLSLPVVWEPELVQQEIDGGLVAWLMAIPLSEAEGLYLQKHGDQALEALLEQHSVDVFDWNRRSVC